MGPRDLLGVGLPGGGEEVGFLGVMLETLGGLLRLEVVRSVNLVEFFSWHVNAP